MICTQHKKYKVKTEIISCNANEWRMCRNENAIKTNIY